MIKKDKAIIVFVRKPEFGKVKSRLANVIGKGNALSVYKRLLIHTKMQLEEFTVQENAAVFVFYTDEPDKTDLWDSIATNKLTQSSGDLGEKMSNAFLYCFKQGIQSVCIIGSDCPQLSCSLLHNAFTQLENHDIVIGPAEDGGYYLLGMKQHDETIFTDKEWSSEAVYSSTIDDIKRLGLSYTNLSTLSDIDFKEDLDRFPHFWPDGYLPE